MLVCKLLQARFGRHVELGEGRVVDVAGRIEPVADLEALDRRVDEGIEHRPHARLLVEIAGGDQALTQSLHRLGLRADLQLDGGNRVPAAARNDALIELDRLFGGVDRRRRQRRRALAADRDAIGGLVALTPLGLVVVGLLRAGRQGGEGRAGEGADRDAGKKSASIDARKPSSRHEQAKPLDDPRRNAALSRRPPRRIRDWGRPAIRSRRPCPSGNSPTLRANLWPGAARTQA